MLYLASFKEPHKSLRRRWKMEEVNEEIMRTGEEEDERENRRQ